MIFLALMIIVRDFAERYRSSLLWMHFSDCLSQKFSLLHSVKKRVMIAMKLSSSSLHQSLFCHMKTFDCNNARSGDLFPLFPHRLCSARDHFTPFRMVKIYHSNADIQNVLFLYVVASHCSTLHDPQCTCPIEWSFLCSFTIFTRQKKKPSTLKTRRFWSIS